MLLVMSGPTILRIFEVTGFDHVIPHATSLAEALARAPDSAD